MRILRSRLRATLPRSALGILVLLIAAGCSHGTADPSKATSAGDQLATAMAVQAGDCIAGEVPDLDDTAPDFGTAVDCMKPHIYEVSDVLSVPDRFLRGSTHKERLANRRKLGAVAGDSTLAHDFRAYTQAACGTSALGRAGMGQLRIAGKPAADVGAEPVMGGATTWINLSPPIDWVAGREQVICSVRFTRHHTDEGNAAPSPISAKNGHPAFYDFLSQDFPADRRQCVMFDDQERYSLNPCTSQHYGELFFSYDATAAFGEEFVDGVDTDDPNDAAWKKLGEPCRDALPTLLGKGFNGSVTAGADFGIQGWFTKGKVHTTYCLAFPYEADEFDLPAGSLVENSHNVRLVPISTAENT